MISHYQRSHQQTYLVVVVVVLSIWLGLTYLYWTASLEVVSKFSNYIQVLSLTIFMITCIVTVLSFKYQNDDRHRQLGLQYATLTQGTVAEVERLFMSNPLLDRLYLEIYQDDPYLRQLKPTKPLSPEVLKMEHHASNYIFQKMADVYAYDDLRLPNDNNVEWINVFRVWMRSPILRHNWLRLKSEQHPEFRHFVDTYLLK